LRELARLDTDGPPLVSLYLQLTPERRVGRAWHSAFSALAHQISHVLDKKERAAVEADLGQIERALSDQLPILGRGVVFFVCRERGIWRQMALPIPLPDQIRFASRPYLRPLLRGWGRHDPPQIAACPRCGSAELEPVDDLVEAALQQALDQKAAVTFIRAPDCRKAFTAMAPLRAWLRY
jgi:peptide subunit release factor 1 (eRF1)